MSNLVRGGFDSDLRSIMAVNSRVLCPDTIFWIFNVRNGRKWRLR